MPDHQATGGLCFRLNGFEVAREATVGIATGSRKRQKAAELGQDQIQDLGSLHLQHALLEEVAQGIGIPITRDLQNAFVHREHGDARGFRGCTRMASVAPGLIWRVRSAKRTGCVRAARSAENGATP